MIIIGQKRLFFSLLVIFLGMCGELRGLPGNGAGGQGDSLGDREAVVDSGDREAAVDSGDREAVNAQEVSQSGTGPAHPDLQAWFAKGQAALQSGELDTAEAEFRRVLSVDPKAGAAYANLGVIAMRRKQWEHALALLQKAERLSPKMAGIRLNIGLVQFRRANYDAAIAPLESVVRDEPDSQQARYLLGLCRVFLGRYAEAVTALEPLWPQMSNDFLYLYVLSIAAQDAGQKELDERALTRLLEIGGDTPEFHLIMGKAYLNREDPEKAIAELERAASANANLPFVHFNLGIAYMRVGDNERTEAEFRKGVAAEPDLADNYEQLGILYLRMGRDAEAEKAFTEALHRDARAAAAQFGLAKVYMKQEKYPQALKAVDVANALVKDSQSVHFLRGQVLMRLGRREEAQAELAKAQKLLDSGLNKDREALGESRVPNPELTRPE